MSKTVAEYIAQSQAYVDGDAPLGPTSALLHYTANSSMCGSGFGFMPDFGFLICWLRYGLTRDEFESGNPPLWKYTAEELRERRAAAEIGYDQLLKDFVEHGYQPEMAEHLLEIGNANFHEFTLNQVFLFPDDLNEILGWTGNPFKADNGFDDSDEEITAEQIGLNLNNPEHCEKLADRLFEVG